ncbi:MAG: peptidase [Chloroflexi bacterium]|nr:peptidase [Chloroflexota bacterium]
MDIEVAHPTPNPVEILQKLIQFDTTNPPGNERECMLYIRDLLAEAGIESTLPARTPERPNLITRLKGAGQAPPLLLYGHVDVVTTANQDWKVLPFEGRIQDGFVWGRGALDMKGPVAMMLTAVLKTRLEGAQLPGDVILAVVTDEEAGSEFGAKFLVGEHPYLFQGVRFALGEFGGFNLKLMGKRFYPIMVAEKQICALKVTFRGAGGHGSMPMQGGAMSKLGKALVKLDHLRLPVHITPPVRLMIESLSRAVPGATGILLGQLTNPALTDFILGQLGERGDLISPMLHNTANPTMLAASDKINVIPCEVYLGLDGRLVPGGTPEQMVSELRDLLGEDFEVEVVAAEPGPADTNLDGFEPLSSVLKELDPTGIPIPYVLSGVTDARFFSRLGIQTYGFTPLKLPDDFNFVSTVHAADERVPVEALDFGVQAIYRALERLNESLKH